MRDPLDTSATEADAAAEERRKHERQRKDAEDFTWLMEHPQGRRFVWRLLERAGVYRTSFNSSGSVTAFNEGKRDIGLWVMTELHDHAPGALLEMITERNA
jgi:hypothetical protein